MSVATLPYQNLKACQKLRLEGTIVKWPEPNMMAAPQINAISSVAAAASISVSHAKSFFVSGANTAIKTNGTIAGDSATGRKKFTSRQWEALIGFCRVETRKQVQKNWKQIEKARDATELQTNVVTLIKEQ